MINRSILNSTRLKQLKSRRKVWLDIHLWLGLSLGLFLSIFGITGSLLVFHTELNELLNPDILTVTVPVNNQDYRPLSMLLDTGKKAMPPTAKHTFSYYPRNDQSTIKMSFSVPISKEISEDWELYINPYNSRITGKRLMTRSDSLFPKTIIGFFFKLHYALLLDSAISREVVGIMGTLLIISTLTGLILWWPLTGKWWQAITIKRKASLARFNFDLHKTFGFYTLLIMIPVLFSGVYMVLPNNVVPLLEVFSPVTYRYNFQSTPKSDLKPITMAQAVAIANKRYPKGRTHWIYGAPDSTDTYTVCKDDVDRPGSLIQRVCVVIDRYTGEYLDIDDPADINATAGEVFTHWQWPLHSGQAFGMPGRILVFLSGLACPLLFITGIIRWLQKRKAKKSRKIKQSKITIT